VRADSDTRLIGMRHRPLRGSSHSFAVPGYWTTTDFRQSANVGIFPYANDNDTLVARIEARSGGDFFLALQPGSELLFLLATWLALRLRLGLRTSDVGRYLAHEFLKVA
jgi:hypothetical protein